MLMEFGEKELAFQLRVAHDTHLRLGWKKTTEALVLQRMKEGQR